MTDTGLSNQGWKDSSDSIFHADGRLAQGPIALCEVQAYAFAARKGAARLARALGDGREAEALGKQAETLRQRFEEHTGSTDLGTYALALDGQKRPCRVPCRRTPAIACSRGSRRRTGPKGSRTIWSAKLLFRLGRADDRHR